MEDTAMTKKIYMQPTIKLDELDMEGQLLANSVQTTGLGDDNLGYDKKGGNQGNAWSRGRSVWDDDEEE